MITIEDLLKKNPSLYKLTNMVIKRALELNSQMQHTSTDKPQRPVTVALNEVLEGKVSCKPARSVKNISSKK